MLSIATHLVGDVAVLQLTGRIVLEDMESPLRGAIEQLIRDGHVKLVLDLKDILQRIRNTRGRFIELDDGQFIALSREFRRRLDE